MFRYKNLMTVCAAVVLAFGLAACGSSDDDTAADGDTPTVTDPAGPTQAELDAEKMRADEAEADLAAAERAAMMAKARKLKGALASELVSPPPADVEVNGVVTERADIYDAINVTAAHGAASKVAVVTDDSTTPETMLAPAFAADGDADDIGGGWSGTRLTRSDSTNSDEMIVYTDVQAPASKPFLEQYSMDPLGITATTPNRLAKASVFPTSGATVTYPANVHTTAGGDFEVYEVAGTYQGADGTFRCTPGTCTVQGTATGLVFSTGWTFDADSGAMVSLADSATNTGYMRFPLCQHH